MVTSGKSDLEVFNSAKNRKKRFLYYENAEVELGKRRTEPAG
jgi:hypothetical protein